MIIHAFSFCNVPYRLFVPFSYNKVASYDFLLLVFYFFFLNKIYPIIRDIQVYYKTCRIDQLECSTERK